jgi:hypothetical protein
MGSGERCWLAFENGGRNLTGSGGRILSLEVAAFSRHSHRAARMRWLVVLAQPLRVAEEFCHWKWRLSAAILTVLRE